MLIGAWVYLVLNLVASYFKPAPYGKFRQDGSRFRIPARVGWMVMECPSLLMSCLAMVHFYEEGLMMKFVLLTPFVIHYFNRSIIFPLQLKKGNPMPPSNVVLAGIFCTFNGFLQSLSIFNIDSDRVTILPLLGLLMFFLGLVINIHSDHVLSNLRKNGDTGYKIPRSGLFQFVSAPNYFGEALEWWGFAAFVQTQGSVWFACFVTTFLGSRAFQTHAWYKDKFREEYPQARKAFIPFII